MTKLIELALVVGGCLAPIFVLANKIDGDEFAKAFAGAGTAACVAAVVAVYRTWRGKQ